MEALSNGSAGSIRVMHLETDMLGQTKFRSSKSEANNVQHNLQKEITTLRDTNRTIQMKLRDIEVSNDDFERQARNTSSSLEDLESKYNIAIERAVMLEEEIKIGEQEREGLRIEAQRLRDELSDLKIEAEITHNQLRRAGRTVGIQHSREITPTNPDISRTHSSKSEHSPNTSASSPTVATPPTKSVSSTVSNTPTPPSPPMSEKSSPPASSRVTSSLQKAKLSVVGFTSTPRAARYSSRPPQHSRGPSMPPTIGHTNPSIVRRTNNRRDDSRQKPSDKLPPSTSLTQIRGLIGKMQRLEDRVQAARSKLPAPTFTPPRASPRPGSALGQSHIPASVTVRSSKKRMGNSNASSISSSRTNGESSDLTLSRRQSSSRLSYGGNLPTPTRDLNHPNCTSSTPTSRASMSSRGSISNISGFVQQQMISSRPGSRQSVSGARTPLGHYSSNTTVSEFRARPRSSIGGSQASSHGEAYSASVRRLSNFDFDESAEGGGSSTPTPSRRSTVIKELSGIPTAGLRKTRPSISGSGLVCRRTSLGLGPGDMGPPQRAKHAEEKLNDVDEVF